MPPPPSQSLLPRYTYVNNSHNKNFKHQSENKSHYSDNRFIGCDDSNNCYAIGDTISKTSKACNDDSCSLSHCCPQGKQQLAQLEQQNHEMQKQEHTYENIKRDLRLSQKLLLQNLFRKKTDVIYENLCHGCGYGVFDSYGNLCNFCACIVNGIKSRQLHESIGNNHIYVDTGENIYENICGKCSEIYNTEECQSCTRKATNSLEDNDANFINDFNTDINPFTREFTLEPKETKLKASYIRKHRNIFQGLFGSLKRAVRPAQAPRSDKRKYLDIIHNIDGFDNVFRTQETFDLNRICELKRSQSSEEPIYGRLKQKIPKGDNICSSTQTLPIKLEQSQSHDHLLQIPSEDNLDRVSRSDGIPTLACRPTFITSFKKLFPSKTKRPRISKIRLLRANPSKTNPFVNGSSETCQPQNDIKYSLYLTDSVCHWMALLRYRVNKYYSYGLHVDDDNYGLCTPKSIPSKHAFKVYTSDVNTDKHGKLPLELLNDIEVFGMKSETFHNNNLLFGDHSIDQHIDSALELKVNDFKLKLMSKQISQVYEYQSHYWQQQQQQQQKHNQSHKQKERRHTAAIAPSIAFALGAISMQYSSELDSEVDSEQQVNCRKKHTTDKGNVRVRCSSEHNLTRAKTTQLLLAGGDEQSITSCCAHCHVITAAGKRIVFHKYDSECVHGIQCAPYNSHLTEHEVETGYRAVNTETNNTVNGEAGDELSKRKNIKKCFATIVAATYQKGNSNYSIICSTSEIQSDKRPVKNHLLFRENALIISALDVSQIVRGLLISNSLKKIAISYDRQLAVFLRHIHNNLYGARNTRINHSHDQLVRKYERLCAHVKRAFTVSRRESIQSNAKAAYVRDCDGCSVCSSVGNCFGIVAIALYQGRTLDESVAWRCSKKVDNYEARAITGKLSAQIVVKRVTVCDGLGENKNVNLIMKKKEGEDDQESFEKMKTNEEVVLREKGKEDVGRSKKAQGTFLDSVNGAAACFPEWIDEQSKAVKNVSNANNCVELTESPESRKDMQINQEEHKIPILSNEVTLIAVPTSRSTDTDRRAEADKEEDIYQPIWKFKTVGEAKEQYRTDSDYYDGNSLATITATALATKFSRMYDSSSLHVPNILVSDYVEDQCEWETDDEFQFIKQLGNERLWETADTGSMSSTADCCSIESSGTLSLLGTTSAGSTITGFESSNATLASVMSSSLQNSPLRSIGIFFSLTEPKLRAIIYEYDRTNVSLYFAKKHSSALEHYSKKLLAKQCTSTRMPSTQTSLHNLKIPTGAIVQKEQFLPDSVQAWKFMLLDVYYTEDEEDMIVSESEILRAQEFKESTTDTQTQHPGQQLNTLQRFKSASFGNLVELPIEDDKKSIAERMRNKLQRGVFKLNMRSPKSEKKSRGIFRRMETGSLYLEEGMKPKYPIFGAQLDQMELDDTTHPHVPRFVVDCVAHIEQKECILQDGLYRASGNKLAIDELKQKLSESYIYDSRLLLADDIHTLTSLLKQFFRELPVPLIPQQTYMRFGRNISGAAGIELLRESFEDMYEPNRSTLKFLIRHLKNVAAYSMENRMPASNLAIVWGPCLFSANQVEFVDIGRMNTLAKVLIENYERIFSESERLVT